MKHFKNAVGQVYAFEADGSQDDFMAELLRNPLPPFAEAKATELAAWRADREKMLNRIAGIGMAAQATGDIALVTAVVAFRQGLLDLPSHPTVTAATDIVSLRAAVKTRYKALLAATPTSAKLAFAGVDA
jgi:glutamate mutase epsilon subunit